MKKTTLPLLNSIKLVLLATTCMLGYLLLSELNRPVVLLTNVPVNKKSEITETISLQEIQYDVPAISSFDEIINRPLFFEDRKPYVYVEPEKSANKTKQRKLARKKTMEQYALNAVIITPERQLAIIQSGREKKLQRISLGESIDDWILENIESRSVLLKKGTETKKLELEIKTSKPQKKTNKQANMKKEMLKQGENVKNNKNQAPETKTKSTNK